MTVEDETKISRERKSRALRAKAPIAAAFEDCQQLFVRLSDSLQLAQHRQLVQKCWSRFDTWDHESGASSRVLDYGLKTSPRLLEQTISLLRDLGWALHQATISIPVVDPDEEGSGSLEFRELTGGHNAISSPGEVEQDEGDAHADFGPVSWLQEGFDIMESLFHLLSAIRNPALEVAACATTKNELHDEVGDLFEQEAKDSFPVAQSELRDRLAQARWNARPVLFSRHDSQRQSSKSDKVSVRRSSIRPSNPIPINIKRSRDASSDNESLTVRPDTTFSESRFGSLEQQSTTSHGWSSQLTITSRPSVPSPPVELDQLGMKKGQFNCPYCFSELPLAVGTAMSPEDWANHFYQDVKPCICTFDDPWCRHISFASREEWFRHELDYHRTMSIWLCGVCRKEHYDVGSFEKHIQSVHADLELTEDLSSLVKSCERLSHSAVSSHQCPLCPVVCGHLEALENHLGNHMESFAIQTIPDPDTSVRGNNLVLMDFFSETGFPRIEPALPFDADEIGIGGPATTPFTAQNLADATTPKDTDEQMQNVAATIPTASFSPGSWTEKVIPYLVGQQANTETIRLNLPSKSDNFAGRDRDLDSIYEKLAPQGRVCVLTGVSGIGKTATAVQFAHHFGAEYPYVFWVEAESPGPLADKYSMIADALHIRHNRAQEANSLPLRIRERLLNLDRKWLLIFDNAVNWWHISPYITKALALSKGSVLITARGDALPFAPSWLQQRHIQLEPLSVDSGRELLLTSIHPRVRKEDLEGDEDFELAAETVTLLKGLPLAISMAAGYVRESGCTLGDFLEIWEERQARNKRSKGGSAGGLAEGVDNTIDALWDIGIRDVPINSRKLLNILSFLFPDRIPRSLLVGDHEENYLEMLHAAGIRSYQRMITKLNGRRLIDIKEGPNEKEPEYLMHRSLKEKIMLDMDEYSISDAFRKTFRLLRKKFPPANSQQVPNPKDWPKCQECMPHINSFHEVYCQEVHRIKPLKAVNSVELAGLFYDAGFHVWSRRGTRYNGLELLKTALNLLDDVDYDRDAKLRADINCIIGLLRLEMDVKTRVEGVGNLKEASRIREVGYRMHPDDHDIDVLLTNAKADYVLCLLNDHHFDEAGDEMKQCLQRYKEWGPESENPFEYSKYYGQYSVVLMFRGEFSEAKRLVRRCMELTEKFGGKTAQWYRRLFLLASYMVQAGDLKEALDLHREILQVRLDLGGKHDDNFLLSLYAVGATLHLQNDIEEATVYMKQCIECATVSRWTNLAFARAQFHLATLYELQGIEEEEAAFLKTEARKVLGKYRDYAVKCVREAGDELMIFDDLQPTLLGRYTGQALLRHLQANLPRPCVSYDVGKNRQD